MSLTEFLGYIAGRHLADITKLNDESDEGYENRIKVHRYIFLARYYGLDLGYKFNLLMEGPYSTTITDDFKTLDLDSIVPGPAPSELRESEFWSIIDGKGDNWLELAETIMVQRKVRPDITREQVYDGNPDHTPEFIDSVYDDLSRLRLWIT